MLLLKDRALLLAATPSLTIICLFYLAYVVCYLALVFYNYNDTGHWPYGFMKEFGFRPAAWLAFTTKQYGILIVFVFIAHSLLRYT